MGHERRERERKRVTFLREAWGKFWANSRISFPPSLFPPIQDAMIHEFCPVMNMGDDGVTWAGLEVNCGRLRGDLKTAKTDGLAKRYARGQEIVDQFVGQDFGGSHDGE